MLVGLVTTTPAELIERIAALASTMDDPAAVRAVLEQLAGDAFKVRAMLEQLGGTLPAEPSGKTWGELEIAAAMAQAQKLGAELAAARARIAAAVQVLEPMADNKTAAALLALLVEQSA